MIIKISVPGQDNKEIEVVLDRLEMALLLLTLNDAVTSPEHAVKLAQQLIEAQENQ